MSHVIDTNVLIAAIRSPAGASARLLHMALTGRMTVLASVPLFVEYESVATRVEHLHAASVRREEVINLLDALASVIVPVEIHYLWRPQLRDPADDMVLEAAVNGRAQTIVSFNAPDFLPATERFGLKVVGPGELLRGFEP